MSAFDRPIDFVVTGFPRSGTRYASRVLTEIGIKCSHEKFFSHNKQVMTFNTACQSCREEKCKNHVFGDASWLAAPYLEKLPGTTKVLWQVRDPIKVLDSVYPGKGSLVGLARQRGPYASFVRRVCPDLAGDSEPEKILYWFIRWFEMLENHPRVNFRYKVEDVDWLLPWIRYHILDGLWDSGIEAALEAVPTDENHRGPTRKWSAEYLLNNNTEATLKVLEIIEGLGYALPD